MTPREPSTVTETEAVVADPRLIRTFFESPLLDEHKWAKAQQMHFDMLLVDLEDTVAPERKSEARTRAVEVLNGGAETPSTKLIPRVNAEDTGFLDDDVAALASTEVRLVAYPKLQSVDELESMLDKFSKAGLTPDVFASVETATGVQAIDEIAAHPRVRGILFGPSDLGLDMGIPLDAAKDLTSPALLYARSRVVTAAAANGLACITMAFPPNMKDLELTREHIMHARQLGFTGMMTFYPPHLELIHSAFTPSEEDVVKARESVDAYTQAREEGQAAAYLASGELVLAFDFERARQTLRRHEIFEGMDR